jgi:RNA polymerase sigma factor (sigma-70 family)
MSSHTDAELVLAVRAGESDAFGELADRWFDRCYDVARGVVRNPEAAADVTQDALISAWQRLDRLDDPEVFGGWLLRITRNRGLDWLRREQRSQPFGADEMTELHDGGAAEPGERRPRGPRHDPEADVVDAERDEILNAAAVALGAADASLLGLHLRHGLTPAEIADELGVTANVAHQRLFRMRNRLGDAIGALLLWHRGRPSCPVLLAEVESAREFDAGVFGTVERHRRTCDECQDQRTALVAPHQLFAALPIATVPLLLRARIVHGLAAAGVPTESMTVTGEMPPSATVAGAAPGPVGSDGLGAEESSPDLPPEPAEGRSTANTRRIAVGVAVAIFLLGFGAFLTTVAAGGGSADAVPATAASAPGTALSDEAGSLTGDLESTAVSSPDATARADTSGTDSPQTDDSSASGGGDESADSPGSTAGGGEAPSAVQPAGEPSAAPPATGAPPPLAPTPTSGSAGSGGKVSPNPTNPPSSTNPPTRAPQPTAATPATAAPVPPPKITSFAAAPGSQTCASPSELPREFVWSTTDATSANLTIGITTQKVATSGGFRACAASGVFATLTASSATGQISKQIQLP